MNSKKIKKAIKEVSIEVENMSKEEFDAMIEKHKDGDFANIYKDIKVAEDVIAGLNELLEYKQGRKKLRISKREIK